jgi:alpha-galactosidase
VCNPEEVWQMTDEMLVALAPWLPQYALEIPQAKKRLANHEKNGTRVTLQKGRGAARFEAKTPAQMAANSEAARKNASAADKGKLTRDPA